jgi:hypothetical protein
VLPVICFALAFPNAARTFNCFNSLLKCMTPRLQHDSACRLRRHKSIWPHVLIAQFRVRERWRRRQIIEFHDRFPAGSRLLIGNFRFLVFIDRRRWGLRCPAHAKLRHERFSKKSSNFHFNNFTWA